MFHNVKVLPATSTTSAPTTTRIPAGVLSSRRWSGALQGAGGQGSDYAFRRKALASMRIPTSSTSDRSGPNVAGTASLCFLALLAAIVIAGGVAVLQYHRSRGTQCKWAGAAAEWVMQACGDGVAKASRNMKLAVRGIPELDSEDSDRDDADADRDLGSPLVQPALESSADSPKPPAPSPGG